MAKREQMYRLMHISNFIKNNDVGVSYEEVKEYLEQKYYFEGFDGELAFSEKTFKRDRKLLEELFGIEIIYRRSTRKYHLLVDSFSSSTQSIFDNLLLVNAYKKTDDNSTIMIFENRHSSGLNHMNEIIDSIKKSRIISFTYTKYWEGKSTKRVVEPYALKEFKNRWYLIASEKNDENFVLKTFGLDRIFDLNIHLSTFTPNEIDVNELFINSFGIISTYNKQPTQIEISFEPWQGLYIKSLPIHSSQKIIVDNETEFKIELNLVPTYDFYQELLTHTGRISAIKPEEVKNEYLTFLNNEITKLNNL